MFSLPSDFNLLSAKCIIILNKLAILSMISRQTLMEDKRIEVTDNVTTACDAFCMFSGYM